MDLSPNLAPAPPALPRCRSTALLIDGENVPASAAGKAIIAARRLGPVSVLRVYGDARRLGGWLDAPGFRVVHAHAGKNVTDMLMTVEAMELSYGGSIDGFALASDDRDLTPLAQSLRARGFPVLGLTGAKSPDIFRKACTEVAALEIATDPAAARLEQAVRTALANGPMTPQAFGHAMKSAGVGLPEGFARWRSCLTKNFSWIAITGDGQAALYSLRR